VSTDPLAGLNAANRYGRYRYLREHMPMYHSVLHSGWVVSRFADVNEVLLHPEAMALDVTPFLEAFAQRSTVDVSSLLCFCSSLSLLNRPPLHDDVRRTLAQSLGGIVRMGLPQLVSQRAEQLLDDGERCGSINLADGYGRAIALFTMGAFLGIPEQDLPMLGALARDFMAIFERIILSVSGMSELNRCAAALTEYFIPLLRARRRAPGEDGLSMIVRLADERYQPSDEQLAQNCLFFFTAAEETTSAAISAAALTVLQRPALRARLCQDPALRGVAQELLRLASPVQYVARQMRRDCDIAGQKVSAGESLILLLGSANRDPAAFPDPDDPVFDRTGPRSVVFAAGPYTCVGAQLATLEVEAALRALLARPHLELSALPPVWSGRMNISPLRELHAVFA
jgi:cytochrome P450